MIFSIEKYFSNPNIHIFFLVVAEQVGGDVVEMRSFTHSICWLEKGYPLPVKIKSFGKSSSEA